MAPLLQCKHTLPELLTDLWDYSSYHRWPLRGWVGWQARTHLLPGTLSFCWEMSCGLPEPSHFHWSQVARREVGNTLPFCSSPHTHLSIGLVWLFKTVVVLKHLDSLGSRGSLTAQGWSLGSLSHQARSLHTCWVLPTSEVATLLSVH